MMGSRFLYLAAALWLSGCAIIPGLRLPEPNDHSGAYHLVTLSPEVLRELRTPGAVAPTLQLPELGASAEEYVVGPGDILTIVVWDHPELTNPTGEFRDATSAGRLVSSDGTIFFPHAGSLKVGGRTVSQIRDDIAAALTRVIQKPQVDVRVAAFRSQRIQVTGEVRQAGLVTLDDTPKGVLEAINERGGLNENASRREAVLVRAGAQHRINIGGLLSGRQPGGNPALRPGDVIHIPDKAADQVFVLGEIEKPAPVQLNSGYLSLTEAITTAGGLDRATASDSGVLIFRRAADGDAQGVPTIFRLDLSEPQGLLLAGEFELRPRDVVYVKATAFAQYNIIINQLLPTISAIFQLDNLVNE